MPLNLKQIEGVLKLEASNRYQNTTGLATFINNWLTDNRQPALSEREAAFVRQVGQVFEGYSRAEQTRRKASLDQLIQSLATLKLPVSATPTSTPPASTPRRTVTPNGTTSGVSGTNTNRQPRSESSATTSPAPPNLSPALAPFSRPPTSAPPSRPTSSTPPVSSRPPAPTPPTSFNPPEEDFPGFPAFAAPPTAKKPVKPAAATPDRLVTTPPKPATYGSGNVDLSAPLTSVKGIGESYAKLMGFVGLNTIQQALYHFPFRHEDFSTFLKISSLMYGQQASIFAQVIDKVSIRTRGGKEIVEVVVTDETGNLTCVFFNSRQAYGLRPGAQMVLSGRVEEWNGKICLKGPVYEAADRDLTATGRLVPVYSSSGPLKPSTLRKLMKTIVDRYAPHVPEHLPPAIAERRGLMHLPKAVAGYHFPANLETAEVARRRLAYDEFFFIQLGVMIKRQEWREERPGISIPVNRDLLQKWIETLNFRSVVVGEDNLQKALQEWDNVVEHRLMSDTGGTPQYELIRRLALTGSQHRAIDDIMADLPQTKPMSRLLQGDVGSGKTAVGAAALLMAVAAGFQASLMAPTQILAEQHFTSLQLLFKGLPELGINIRLELLTGKITRKAPIYQRIAQGEVDIIIGTSAVIQESVNFSKLGLVIIDEQHRFGVLQRKELRGKGAANEDGEGANPHLLVMTATPIPRTLSLTVMGDLDLTTLNEMPPGRRPIKTRMVLPQERQKAYDFIRKQVGQGRQAFIICPLVEESENIEAKSAVEEHERLQREVFTDLKLGLLHGRMKPREKEAIMLDFRDRRYDILVSTSVIEVGIDIPNASVIMIEGSERFGLAQLHQFRGRVGRGQHQSYCLLFGSDDISDNGVERLRTVESTNDGFELAEQDLRMRGPGEFFGTRQSGDLNLRVAGPKDVDLLELAREDAIALFAADPDLSQPQHEMLAARVARMVNLEGDLS